MYHNFVKCSDILPDVLENIDENGILLKFSFFDREIKWEYLATKIDRDNQTVIVSNKPAIFTEVNKKNYKLLWPVAAKQFIKNDDFKKRNLIPVYMKMSDIEWKIYKLKSYRHRYNLIVLIGCILCNFKIGCFSKLKEVYDYLVEKGL